MSRGPGYGGRVGPHGGNVSPHVMGGANLGGHGRRAGWGSPRRWVGPREFVHQAGIVGEFTPCDGGPPTDARRQPIFASCRWAATPRLSGGMSRGPGYDGRVGPHGGNVSSYAMGGANWGFMDDGLDGVRPADGWDPVSLSTKPGSSGSLPRAMVGPPTDARRQPIFASCRWAATPRLSGWMSRGPGYGGRVGPHGGNVSPHVMGGANLGGHGRRAGWGSPRRWVGPREFVHQAGIVGEFTPCDGGPPTDARRQPIFASCRWAATPRLSGGMSRGPGYDGRVGPHGGNVSSYAMGGANWGFMDDGLDGGTPPMYIFSVLLG